VGTFRQREGGGVRSGLARARRHAEDGPREEERGREGRGGRGFGPGFGPTGGRGGFFSFSFYFLIPISLFASFSFEQFIL
jgi:hypothetical protein